MKKVFIFIAALISLLFLSCSSNINKPSFYGTYTFKEVSYLSPLSFCSIDHLNEGMKGTKYIIKSDLFKIDSPDNPVKIDSPIYKKEEIPQNSMPLYDVRTIIGDEVKCQYSIYDRNRNKTHWRLYASQDCLWVASYADNTANGSDIIMSIYKLSK